MINKKYILALFIMILSLTINTYASDIVIIDDLAWENTLASKELRKNWKASQRYCQTLELGGYNDWRLPKIEELQSLIDLEKYRPAINDKITQISVLTFYWSNTVVANETKKAWHVFYKYGEAYYSKQGEKYAVRCVRNLP